ncbi:MAG TPA: site-2 protease family protein, partial [Myxococcota bacterium]
AAATRGSASLEVQSPPAADAPADAKPVRRTVTLSAAPAPVPVEVALDRFGVTADEAAAPALRARIEATRQATATAHADAARRFGIATVDGRIAAVAPGTVASEQLLSPEGDRVVAVDGKPLALASDLESALTADPDGIHAIGVVGRSAPQARPEVLAFRMLPAPERQMGGIKVLGVRLDTSLGDGAVVERSVSAKEALQRAVQRDGDTIADVVRGLGMLVTGGVGLQALSGPIGIAKLSGEAAHAGLEQYVDVMALISVNLGVINLLPIPVLDGGHLLFFVIELFTRRRVSVEARRKATMVGLAVVGLLMIIAVTNDVLGLLS